MGRLRDEIKSILSDLSSLEHNKEQAVQKLFSLEDVFEKEVKDIVENSLKGEIRQALEEFKISFAAEVEGKIEEIQRKFKESGEILEKEG